MTVSRTMLPITCTKYLPIAGTRRCTHFEPNGACRLPDEFMCTEWLKANGHAPSATTSPTPVSTTPSTTARRALGAAPPPFALTPAQTPSERPHGAPTGASPTASPLAPLAPRAGPQRASPTQRQSPPAAARDINDDIASFKARSVEVHVVTDTLGDVVIVPAYTGADRQELSVEHAAMIAQVCAAFPGARVTAIRPSTKST
ncbi:MAG: hypothetical protein ACHQQR_11920 [Gemmatimonadales bacterium]